MTGAGAGGEAWATAVAAPVSSEPGEMTGLTGAWPRAGAALACAAIGGGTAPAAAEFPLADGRLAISVDGNRAVGVTAAGPLPSEASIDAGDGPVMTGTTPGAGRAGGDTTGATGDSLAMPCGAATALAIAGDALDDAATIVGAVAVLTWAGAVGSGAGEAWATAIGAAGLTGTGATAGLADV